MMQQRRGGARIYKGSTATSTTRSTTVMGQHRQRFRGIRSIAPDRPSGAGFKRESWHAGVRPAPRVIPWDARSTPSGHEVTQHSLSACQMRKNTNQTMPRIRTARAIETVRSARTEGPGSAWRASVGVSTIRPSRFVVAISEPLPVSICNAGQMLGACLKRTHDRQSCSGQERRENKNERENKAAPGWSIPRLAVA